MTRCRAGGWCLLLGGVLAGALLFMACTLARAAEAGDWRDIVRGTPYWESQGVARNLSTIRHWVLRGAGYCERADRHILFDRRMRFLGYLDDQADSAQTQAALNAQRQRLWRQKRVTAWVAGTPGQPGYPFALACNQPHADLNRAVARMMGAQPEDLLWGTWDGMRLGSPEAPMPLVDLILAVYRERRSQNLLSFPEQLLPYLLGQVMIESGGLKMSRSRADARGLMQLTPRVLSDCGIPERHWLHRMAQVDCALRLFEQNHRNLNPQFAQRFGHLPERQQRELYGYLLVQAYHGGVGRVRELLADEGELGAAARYFARHHGRFSAEDIALGLVYHNLGRRELGFASLYYLTDVGIAVAALCEQPRLRAQSWCRG